LGRVLGEEDPAACPACGGGELVDWREATAADPRASRRRYVLARCRSCGSAATRGRSHDDAATLYRDEAYASPSPGVDRGLEPLRRLADRWRLHLLEPLRPGSDVFEIGVGDGRLFHSLEQRGHLVAGTEPFAAFSHPRVSSTPAEELDLPRGSLDTIVLWHVLEHFSDPHDLLLRVAPALRPAGRVVISVPNLGSLQARLGGDRWFHQDVPRHAVHFTREGLTRLLGRSGLRVVGVRTMVLDQNLLGMAQTLLTVLSRGRGLGFAALKAESPSPSALALTLAAAVPIVPLAALLEGCAVAAGCGGSLVVHASPVAP
jgi:Methyltransferase domain